MNIKKLALIVMAALATGLATAQTETNATTTNAPTPAAAPATPAATNAPDTAASSVAEDLTPTNALRMNFHDAPLSTVLNYLSARMGFVIASETELRGNVTIVSEQPVDTNEVIGLLSSALAKNNYSVSRNGRVLTITTTDNAKPDAPVHQATKPDQIPVNDEMATYILPVQVLNPTQLLKDLDQLIPPGATVAANEAGNAVIMTARQRDIHRFSEIINALDGSSVSEVEVFVLKYADAKSVADELKEVFQSPDSTVARADARTRFQGRGGGGGFPGFGGFGGGGGGNDNTDSKNAANKAVFTSDDQMNAVIASAPPDYFTMITNVVDQLDQPTSDITMIKVFHLQHADATEIANELYTLFPDPDSNNNQNNRSMGTRFLPPWMQQQTPVSTKSARMTQQALVRAVPDARTASVIVTTSKDQMDQIAEMITTLDQSDAQVQHVFAFSLENADPVTVQAAMTALFAGQNTKTPSANSSTSALTQRATSTAQSQTSTTTSGFGSSGGGGGGSPAIP